MRTQYQLTCCIVLSVGLTTGQQPPPPNLRQLSWSPLQQFTKAATSTIRILPTFIFEPEKEFTR